jgi:dihydrofolate reductase
MGNYYDRIIWIAGGEQIYRLWMPYVRRCFITRVDYDGPADVWMPPLWDGLIPSAIDQNPCAHWRNPMDMIRQG